MSEVQARRIVFPEQHRVELETFDVGPVPDDRILLRTRYSLMSTGTENIILAGLFDDGTHWSGYARYPFHPGYSAVGEVTEVGASVRGVSAGDLLAARAPHASVHVLDPAFGTPIPVGLDLRRAVWFGLAKIALMGARAARYGLGSTVLVVGAGPIGQMSVRWASAAGVRQVVVVDPATRRLEAARRGGAATVINAPADSARAAVLDACGGILPDVVIDTTGNAAVLAPALGLVADRGRVVVLGDTGYPAHQHLTSDLITRGLEIVGAHDAHSMTGPNWDGDRSLHELFFDLLQTGRFDVDGLVTNEFAPEQCVDAYELVQERRADTLGVLFDWD
ncbi:MAG: zinc-binding alcohol dehydrogenase [Acidimicrobiia bacterium]